MPGSEDGAALVRELATRLRPYHRRYEAVRDARAVFAFVYLNITLDLAKELESQRVAFDDAVWVAKLAVAFGNRFIHAMDSIDRWLASGEHSPPEYVPKPWADVYLAIRGNQSYVLEDLVYSMMAHISFDLPNALLDIPHGPEHLADYHRMNDVLAKRTNKMQSSVARRYQRFLFFLDRLTGTFDEFLTNYGIRAARSVAYYNAIRLETESAQEAARVSIENSTQGFIESVRNPDAGWLKLLIKVARFLIPRRRRWPVAGAESDDWEPSSPIKSESRT